MSGEAPSLGGFQAFVSSVMGVSPSVMDPTTSPYVGWSYDFAIQWVNKALQTASGVPGASTLYAVAVYNLAADTLINLAQDAADAPAYVVGDNKENLPYWQWLRAKYQVLDFVAGVVQSTGDNGTSSSFLVPEAFSHFTIANLQNLKTPYGRRYLGIAQSWGTLWGMS